MTKPNLFPDDYIQSIFEVDFEALYQEGYRAIIFDVDNTLVPHGAPADERSIEFFSYLHGCGFCALLLSNNKEPRVKAFAERVKYAEYIYKAGKPGKAGYQKAMERMKVTKEETLFAGDQIFTDIWGANRCGIRTIMVKPVLKWKEEIQIILKRFLEAPILLAFQVYRKLGGAVRPAPLKQA